MSEKHTPGPWHWVNPDSDEAWDGKDCDFYLSLRTVEEWQSYCGHYTLPKFILTTEDFGCDTHEVIANARLIAAAPDLLEAASEVAIDFKITLGNVFDASKTDPRWQGVYEKLMPRVRTLEAAIEKARGES